MRQSKLMKELDFSGDPHRQKHFDFFRQMDQPHFNICGPVEITGLKDWCRERKVPVTPVIVYLLSRVANSLPVFRQRVRGDRAVEHPAVHPSFTVPTEASSVFSFCTVEYHPSGPVFLQRARRRMEEMARQPSFEDEAGRDDYLYLSALPWIRFTGLTHAMHHTPADSVPRISWGQFYEENGRLLMPLSVQAHHALVDGRDTGAFFRQTEQWGKNFGTCWTEANEN